MTTRRWVMPLKVATALTLSIVIALALGWNKPYWAAFAVIVMAATETNGHSLKKGRHRIIGTFAGVIIAFVLVDLFAQHPLALLLAYSLIIAVCIYQQTNPKNGYAWTIGLMVSCVIIVMGKLSAEQTFDIAALRLQETILGVICFSFVFSLFSPVSSRVVLLNTLLSNAKSKQEKIEQAIIDIQSNEMLSRNVSWSDSLKYLARIDDLLQAAKTDSYQINSEFPIWETIRDEQNQWVLLGGHLSEAINLIEERFTTEQKQQLIVALTALKNRYVNTITLLSYVVENPQATNNCIRQHMVENTLSVDQFSLPSLLHHKELHHGAFMMLAQNLVKMDTLQASIYQHLTQAILSESPSKIKTTKKASSALFNISLDSERLINVFKILVIFWISVGLWLFIPMQGGVMIVMLSLIFGSVALSLPFVSPRYILMHMIVWSVLALLQYIFILPHLSQIWQLGLFYFINVFVLWFYFNQPQQVFHRLLGCQNLMLMTTSAIQLVPTYSVETSLLTILLLFIGLLVIFWVYNGIYSSQPEYVFLRQLSQFRIRLHFGLKKLVNKNTNKFFSLSISAPVQAVSLAEMASTKINWVNYEQIDKAQVTTLLNLGYRSCFYYRSFTDSYEQWQATQYNENIDIFIVECVQELIAITGITMICENISTIHASKLTVLQVKLTDYRGKLPSLYGQFTQDEMDKTYQLITSLLLFIASLDNVSKQVMEQSLYQLKFTQFAL
ncbi:FUSC family protein [Photobacterium piscicola]|uniref:FUSC family protein n=1 Tax=Photobacterium piscicola TaxID=1378299 RepID=UPI0038D200FA